MLRIALKNVAARFGRVVLTALAIIASTAFLSGTFVYRDTVGRTFDALFAHVYDRVDAYVQSSNTVETAFGFEIRDKLPAAAVDTVRAVPGVADAQAFVQDDAVVIGKSGKPMGRRTAPSYGATINAGSLSVWKLIAGRTPSGASEIALDDQTVRSGGFALGEPVKVNAEGGSRTFTLVGIARYDELLTPGNGTWALFDAPTATEFVSRPGFVDAVLVRGDGSVGSAELTRRIQAALDPGEEALTSAQITEQSKTEVSKALGFVTIFLSVFSFIALAVGSFVIFNMFSVTAAQRRREHALLRAIGASRRQVTAMVLIEAAVVGLVGSLVGLVGGIGLAAGIRSVLTRLGFGIPAHGLAIERWTVGITVVSGLAATMVAAVAPAIASGRVPPVAAMAETSFERPRRRRGRLIAAASLAVAGAAGIVAVAKGAKGAVLGTDLETLLLAGSVVILVVAVLLLGPAASDLSARTIGALVARTRGVTGSMARGNVRRNPSRTARTAAPVLIGVALVTGASVFAASIKTQLRDTIGKQFRGDYVINSTNGGALSFSQSFVDGLNELPEVGAATGLGFAALRRVGSISATFATTVNPATAVGILDYDFVEGSFAALTPDGLLVSTGDAQRQHLTVGSTVAMLVGSTPVTLRVEGIYRSSSLTQARVIHRDLLKGTSVSSAAGFVFLTRAPGVSDQRLRTAVDRAIKAYGIGELQDRNQFIAGRSDIVDQSLAFVYGLLALSVVIAVFGIVLTMLLAVYERRRETGLLRAVGMSKAQVRTMVRWESVLTSLYGALMGVVLGLALGDAIIASLHDRGLTTYSVPVGSIGVIVVLAFVAGVVAAVLPAWRATRFDVLAAIAADG